MIDSTPGAGVLAFRGAVLRSLRERVAKEAGRPWEAVERQIDREVDWLMRQNEGFAVDLASSRWLGRAAVVLAAYRALCSIDRLASRAIEELRGAVVEQFGHQVDGYLTERFGIEHDKPQEAFARISENFQKRGEARFGSAFRYEWEVRDEARNFVNIRRCGYHDFFRTNGAPEVTSVFCTLDIAWADEMRRRNYPVRFERPTTLAQGSDACRFQFTKATEAK